jgi:hypothetical protein
VDNAPEREYEGSGIQVMAEQPYLYYLGLDRGQARGYSALAIIEEQLIVGEAWAHEVLYAQDLERGVSPGTWTGHSERWRKKS